MGNSENLGWKGKFTITVRRGATVVRDPVNGRPRAFGGEIISQRISYNTLLNVGRSYLIQRIMDDGANVVSGTAAQCIYVGTTASGGAAVAGDTTAANTEIARETFTYMSGALGACSATATFVSATANGSIREAGIFAGGTTSGDGVFIARTLFTAVNKTSTDVLVVKYDVSFTGT